VPGLGEWNKWKLVSESSHAPNAGVRRHHRREATTTRQTPRTAEHHATIVSVWSAVRAFVENLAVDGVIGTGELRIKKSLTLKASGILSKW
jgi:hypothetical protein